jgi:hypothetical protein
VSIRSCIRKIAIGDNFGTSTDLAGGWGIDKGNATSVIRFRKGNFYSEANNGEEESSEYIESVE